MSCIIRNKDKRNGIVYVYESTSYWDPETKMPRCHRKLIGKEDPETGEIVPTGKRGRPKKNAAEAQQISSVEGSADPAASKPSSETLRLKAALDANEALIATREERISALEDEVRRLNEAFKLLGPTLDSLDKVIGSLREICGEATMP